MSDSYPYLALSRRLGIPYGRVLSFSDSLEKHRQRRAGELTCWERSAMDDLSVEHRREIIKLYEELRTRHDQTVG